MDANNDNLFTFRLSGSYLDWAREHFVGPSRHLSMQDFVQQMIASQSDFQATQLPGPYAAMMVEFRREIQSMRDDFKNDLLSLLHNPGSREHMQKAMDIAESGHDIPDDIIDNMLEGVNR